MCQCVCMHACVSACMHVCTISTGTVTDMLYLFDSASCGSSEGDIHLQCVVCDSSK